LSESHKPTSVSYAVYCGLDVGKGVHHACALDPDGTKLYDRPLPNDEAALRKVLADLSGHGKVLVIVDEPASIGEPDQERSGMRLAHVSCRKAARGATCCSGA